jgi:hypothetical protein
MIHETPTAMLTRLHSEVVNSPEFAALRVREAELVVHIRDLMQPAHAFAVIDQATLAVLRRKLERVREDLRAMLPHDKVFF